MRGNYVRSWTWAAGPLVLLSAGALAIATNVSQAQVKVNALFGGGGGSAAWSKAADAPGDTDGQAIKLTVTGPGGYAGIDLFDAPPAPPTTAPSFWFESSVSGAAEGSPRLVIAFSDHDYIDMQPTTWTAGTWTKVDGATTGWNDAGQGGCATLNSVTYQQALACHLADHSTVSDLYVVSDASYPGGFVNYIDDISYAGTTITTSAVVLPAFAPHLTGFARTARVSVETGEGQLNAFCRVTPGAQCHVALTLKAKVNGQTVTIGRVQGLIAGNATTQLVVLLNGRGRSLLLGHEGSVSATATGSVSDEGGTNRTPFSKHLTLRAS